jgi:hypothetical protein
VAPGCSPCVCMLGNCKDEDEKMWPLYVPLLSICMLGIYKDNDVKMWPLDVPLCLYAWKL